MANVIKLKRSETSSSIPGTSDLVVGEVCMNVADQKIYTKKSDNSIVIVGSHGLTDLDGSVTTAKLADGAVTTVKLAADAVDGTKLADDACNSEHYTNGSVDDVHISGMAASKLSGTITPSDNTVTGAKIALGSDAAGDVIYYDGTNYVRLAKGSNGEVLTLASGVPSWAADSTNVGGTSVGGDLTGTVSNASIAANAIDGTHIALGSDAAGDVMYYNGTNYVRLAKGTAGQVLTINSGATAPEWAADSTNVGATSVGGDVTGTVANIQIASGAVGTTELAADAVDGSKIADDAINSEHYAAGSIDTGHIANAQITTALLAADAVDGTKIADDALNSEHYTDGSIDLAHLSADCVDGTKIADDAINSEHLVNGSVDDAHISGMAASKLSGTITPSDNTVTGAKIALGSDAQGDIMYYNGTDYVRLAKGTAAQVLTINSGATAPEWAASSGMSEADVSSEATAMSIALG